MRPSEILEHQRRQPFTPIRIHVSDGAFYDVPHPEFIAVTKGTIFIAQPPDEDGVPGRSVWCDPVHITRIELIGNGE